MPSRRLRQKQLGPAPLASFDSGLSSVYNSFDEGLGTVGYSADLPGSSQRHIGVLCQTSIMEETAVVVKTRSIACQTERSALRDGVKSKPRKSSQSQTSFEAEPITIDVQSDSPLASPSTSSTAVKRPTVLVETRTYNKQSSLQPSEYEVDRAPSPSRPQTLDLSKKQKKSPTSFSKVQKLDVRARPVSASSAPSSSSAVSTERKRSLLSKKSSDPSASPDAQVKSRSSSFKSPFKRKESTATGGSSSSRSASPMLSVRQRMASLSPRRSKKNNLARNKLEALLTHVQVSQVGTDVMETGDLSASSTLNRNSNRSLSSPRPPSHSLSPKAFRKGESHALNKLQQLIDRTRLSVSAHPHDQPNHTNQRHSVDVHHGHADDGRRRSKSTPPQPEPLSAAHRVSMGDVWGFHHHQRHHTQRHSHDTATASSVLSNDTPSNPPSPFEPETVTKKSAFSLQEPKGRPSPPQPPQDNTDDDDDDDDQDEQSSSKDQNNIPFQNTGDEQTANEGIDTEGGGEDSKQDKEDTLLTATEENEEDLPSGQVSDILDKVLREQAKRDIAQLRQKVRDERQKRQTFRTAPVQRPRSATRDMAVVDLEAYVAEAEKEGASTQGSAQRIKLKLRLNQQDSSQQSIDDDGATTQGKEKEGRQPSLVDGDDWKRFCQQGLLNKRASRLQRSTASQGSDWQPDFTQASFNQDNKLPIPIIIETAWTPQEHRLLNVTPSPSGHFRQSTDHASSTNDNSPTASTPPTDQHNKVDIHITANVAANPEEAFGGDSASAQSPSTASHNAFASDSFAAQDSFSPIYPGQEHSDGISPLSSSSTAAAAGVEEVASSASAVTMSPATSGEETAKTVVPTRKAPPAPVRKAPPPPGPPSSAAKVSVAEPLQEVSVIGPAEENVALVPQDQDAYYGHDDPTLSAAYYANYSQDGSAAYYYTDEAGNYYSYGDYSQQQQWDGSQGSADQYGYDSYDSTGQAAGEYYQQEDNQGVQAVLSDVRDSGRDAILTDPTAIDTAPDQEESNAAQHHYQHVSQEQPQLQQQQPSQANDDRLQTDTEQDSNGLQGQHAGRSPLLSDSQGEESEANTVIWNPASGQEGRQTPNATTLEDNETFQALAEEVGLRSPQEDDGSGIDLAQQSKHRRLSKVPYTSLDVQDEEEAATDSATTTQGNENMAEEESVTPLLQAELTEGGEGTEGEAFPPPPEELMIEGGHREGSDVYATEGGATQYDYDLAIYDPHGTGYAIGSQEYNAYYYPQHATEGEGGYDASAHATENHVSESYYGTAEDEQYYAQEPSAYATGEGSASVPSYEYSTTYSTTYPAAQDYSSYPAEQSTTTHSHSWSYGADSQQPATVQPARVEQEWKVPTYATYLPPTAATTATSHYPTADEQQYEEEEGYEGHEGYEGYGQEEAVGQTSALPRERLFDEEETLPFGQFRPQPKKKDPTLPLHMKMAKGLKPSKKKVMNLITKGKYSSGKKKDLFDDLEQSFQPGKGGESESEEPAAHSAEWQAYQNMTARVEQTMGAARQKITPLHTPSSPPSDNSLHPSPARPAPPSRPVSPMPKANVDDLLAVLDQPAQEEVKKAAGPPGRPPPPKGKPGRPPPPKKAETPTTPRVTPTNVEVTNTQNVAQETSSSAIDELADFFSAPVPAPTPSKAEKLPLNKISSSSSRSAQSAPAATRAPASASQVVPTEIKPLARPKPGDKSTKSTAATEAPLEKAVSKAATPAAPPPKKSIDDLLGLFDVDPQPQAVPVTATPEDIVKVEPAERDPFATEDPFASTVSSQAVPAATTPSAVYTHRGANGFITRDDFDTTETVHDGQAPQENNGLKEQQGGESGAASATQPSPADEGNVKVNGTSSASTTSESWDPWASTPAQVTAVTSSPSSAPPTVPARPPPPPRPPSSTPKMSRKDMFLQSNSQDSDVTFAAAFSHTRDESPDEEAPTDLSVTGHAIKAAELAEAAQQTTVVSQVESMLVHSQPSPTPSRKASHLLPKANGGDFSAWGDDDSSASKNAFQANFDSDPFADNTAAATQETDPSDPEAAMLKLVASYKNKAPEKINLNAEALDDSFFDPFATIVPEESPLPPQRAPAASEEDDFAIWEAPGARPATLPAKGRAGRKMSQQSNASRRTSQGSASTPLYDEDDTAPMPEFMWDHPQSSWTLALRYPPKKTFTGTRGWKDIFVKLQDNVILLYHNAKEAKPFHEVPLQGNYVVTEIAVHQELDVFTKIFTTKIEYVLYKERVGIRPGQIGKINKGQITKLGLPLEHASQNTELLKFGSLRIGVLRDFVHAIEDVLFRMPMVRERPMIYKQSEIQAHVIDEFTAKVDKQGIISERKGRVRVYCLAFLSGMPEVEFGLNDIQRRGKEVVGRHDILPIYTEEWIRMENVEMHHCVSKEEHAKNQMIKFVPPDACFFELVRFRVRPPRSRDLPLAIKVHFIMEGYKVGIKVEAMTTDYYRRKRAQPCDDIQIRVPVPEQWIYLFRTEKLLGYGSKHAQSKKGSMMKELREKIRTAGAAVPDTSAIAVTAGSARYEHCYRSLVWRLSRLPKEGQGAGSQHQMTCKLDLNSYDTMPQSFEPNAEIEFTMPAATMSHTTLRSISTTCDEPPEKWVKYLAKYEYVVEIDYKIDRGDVQLYGDSAINFE
ncbi:hypothetical protein RvY_18296 [Ramazzottius varieornatus]|uniref:Uncharacterized protein n=1 Tax=Ramazzottius varieornatus TaxID=947166 RepID=A0A1D1W582_RAMVA|nr:hypothetical protein RvY_18296 [Ramazzottius varieornatus]